MSKLDDFMWRWTPVLLGVLVFAVIVFVVAGVRHESAQREEFRQLCADSGGRALAYANGSDLCVDSDGRIIITR